MKAIHECALAKAFVEDHRHLTRGFRDLMQCLRREDWVGARDAAETLDRLGGPHIEFEERYLYPRVRQLRGDGFADALYDEHEVGRQAIATLLMLGAGDALSADQRDRLLAESQIAYDHAVACGALLSHLTVLPPEEQRRLAERLTELREKGRRWTRLHTSPERPAP